MQLDRNLTLIYVAASLRSTGVGLTGVLLGVYLSRAGFSATRIGIVITAGLAAAALGTLMVSLYADQIGRRRVLVGLSLVAALGGFGFASTSRFSGILLLAFTGMINGMGTDRGPAFSLDQALIPQITSANERTVALSWHTLFMDIGHTLGALGAGLPLLLQRWLSLELLACYKITFVLYATVNALTAVAYLLLSPTVEIHRQLGVKAPRARLSPQSRPVVTRLAALSGIDSLGGGFLTDALLAYWFFQRFGIRESSLGLLFSVGNVLNSGSYLIAAWLARRIGLVNTMVFTHIPSSLLLMAVPLSPSSAWAVAFYLAWQSLVEMDVPTRQSYIMAVVQPEERSYSSGITNLTRNVARAVSPSLAGYVMQHLALATPLFIGGGLKIVYDVLLYAGFRSVRPPEEQASLVEGASSHSTRGGKS